MRLKRAALAAGLAGLLLPAFALAQTDLRGTIRGALLNDPRTASMDPSQIESMVDILAAAAERKGVTAQDITWRPQPETTSTFVAPESCGDGVLCAMSDAFGITGSDHTIAIWLGASSMLLILLIALMLEHHRAELRRKAGAAPVPGPGVAQ